MEGKQGQADIRRGKKTTLRNEQRWTLLAQIMQLKTELDEKGLV